MVVYLNWIQVEVYLIRIQVVVYLIRIKVTKFEAPSGKILEYAPTTILYTTYVKYTLRPALQYTVLLWSKVYRT